VTLLVGPDSRSPVTHLHIHFGTVRGGFHSRYMCTSVIITIHCRENFCCMQKLHDIVFSRRSGKTGMLHASGICLLTPKNRMIICNGQDISYFAPKISVS